jgi:Cof subfamily protein (haloacid dehalogenase superfamily)
MPQSKSPMVKMILIDLDGTLLNNDKVIGIQDYETLKKLEHSNIVRVFATGRTLFSALNVLPNDCPFDYLVFSSGAGVLEWKTKRVILANSIQNDQITEIIEILKGLELNFSIHLPIPQNHKYYYHVGKERVVDFEHRNQIYADHCLELPLAYPKTDACQFLIILNDDARIDHILKYFIDFSLIRATSPIDGKSVWLEIFSKGVSKASGGRFLCDLLKIDYAQTVGIGNDYNDIELLDWTCHSFAVENATYAIRQKYLLCKGNQNNPLTDVCEKLNVFIPQVGVCPI